jgi:hypothetical protein
MCTVRDTGDSLPTPLGESSEREKELQVFFHSTDPWNRLPEAVTNLMAFKFASQKDIVFQGLLEEANANDLVNKHCIQISKDNEDPELCIMLFAHTLYNYGSMYTKELINPDQTPESQLARVARHAESLFQCARAIQSRFVSATFGLAVLYGTRSNFEKSIELCEEALSEINQIMIEPAESLSIFERTAKKSGIDLVKSQVTGYVAKIKSLQSGKP